jgi:hypothetical protein
MGLTLHYSLRLRRISGRWHLEQTLKTTGTVLATRHSKCLLSQGGHQWCAASDARCDPLLSMTDVALHDLPACF